MTLHHIFYSKKFTVPTFIVALTILIIVGYGVTKQWQWLYGLDISSLNWLTNHFGEPKRQFEGGLFHQFMTFCAEFGEVKSILILTAIICIALLFKSKRTAIWLLIAIYSGTLMNYLIKQMIGRPRPYNHLERDHGFSFPSGHSNASALLTIAIIILTWSILNHKLIQISITTITVIVWLGILACRLYFHAHYMTDVIGGVALAFVWMMLFLAIYPLFYFKQMIH